MSGSFLPDALAEIREDFLELGESERLQLLAEFSDDLPDASAVRESAGEGAFERVAECQSPVYIFVELDGDGRVVMHAIAPAEAPTTRGFASVLTHGLSGLDADEALAVPEDFPMTLGLGKVVSPLRLAGMVGMLARAQRQVRARRDATA